MLRITSWQAKVITEWLFFVTGRRWSRLAKIYNQCYSSCIRSNNDNNMSKRDPRKRGIGVKVPKIKHLRKEGRTK